MKRLSIGIFALILLAGVAAVVFGQENQNTPNFPDIDRKNLIMSFYKGEPLTIASTELAGYKGPDCIFETNYLVYELKNISDKPVQIPDASGLTSLFTVALSNWQDGKSSRGAPSNTRLSFKFASLEPGESLFLKVSPFQAYGRNIFLPEGGYEAAPEFNPESGLPQLDAALQGLFTKSDLQPLLISVEKNKPAEF